MYCVNQHKHAACSKRSEPIEKRNNLMIVPFKILLIWITLIFSVEVIAQQSLNFRVKASHMNGEFAYSNEVLADRPFTLFIPNAFTPNGDGLNDVFKIKSENFSFYHMAVYNRWGDLLFESHQVNQGWDGSYQDNVLPVGVYSYQVVLRDMNGTEWNETGQVTLARND